MKKVEFELISDVLTCGVNTELNFLTGNDYIPGSVIRAGFAKDIYLSCDIEDRDNFIELKDSDICASCPKKGICEKFSDMKFSFFYKKDCIPAPFTTKRCKVSPSGHKIKDTMLQDGFAECGECRRLSKTAGRMEDAKGYINYKTNKVSSVLKNTMTHTAINYASGAAKNGSLYTTRAIAGGQIFEGCIDDCGSGLLKEGTVVYAGKYSSAGFGKLVVRSITDAEDKTVTEEMLREFTENYSAAKPENKRRDLMYAPILFLSDAWLDFKSDSNVRTTEEYRKLWNEKIFGSGSIFNVEAVYARNRIYSGYDTSREWGAWEKKGGIQTLKGSSVLISFPSVKLREAVSALNEMLRNGIGGETGNGFGQIDVCNKIHLMGVKDSDD